MTITEFGDLRCPICKTFDNEVVPTLVENFVRTGKAKMQFKTWPILGPELGRPPPRRPMRRSSRTRSGATPR